MSAIFNKKKFGAIAGILVIVVLFFLASYFSETYQSELEVYIGSGNNIAKLIYIAAEIIATVIAPVSTMPLTPIAAHAWGWVTAGILSIIGWSIGAQIAFIIARKLGKPFVEKMFSLEKLNVFENYFVDKNLFWFVVFLRIILPVDILSYAIGLFSKMKSAEYFLATLIGITPFAFIFSYTGELPIKSQIIIILAVAIVIGIIYATISVIRNRK